MATWPKAAVLAARGRRAWQEYQPIAHSGGAAIRSAACACTGTSYEPVAIALDPYDLAATAGRTPLGICDHTVACG